jgi:hypothetical protein
MKLVVRHRMMMTGCVDVVVDLDGAVDVSATGVDAG